MLDLVRRHASSWLIKTVLFLIVIVFIFWGGYSYQERQKSHLVRIDDAYITWHEYTKAYDQLMGYYRHQMGKNLSEEMLKKIDVKRQALDLLIDQTLLLKYARTLGISVSPGEMQEAIQSIEAFQSDGHFDIRRYKFILQQNRMTPEMFEHELAQSLSAKKLESFILRQFTIVDDDVVNYVRILKTEKRFLCTTFPWATYEATVVPTEEALRAHYEANRTSYEEPEKRRISYVLFKTSDFTSGISVSEDELRAYYEDHRKDYSQEKAVHARHILIRVGPEASQAEVEEARSKAQRLLDMIRGGKSFEEVAREHSEDPGTAAQGGDLGYFTEKTMVKEFAEAVFSLKPGEIGDLVRTKFGFHIIKVEDVRPAQEIPFETARSQIQEKLIEEQARERAFSHAREFADLAVATRDLAKAAAEKQRPLVDVQEWLPPTQPLPSLPESGTAMKVLFGLQERAISDVVELPSGFLVAQIQGIQPSHLLSFEEAREKVVQDYKAAKAEETALRNAEKLLADAKTLRSLQEAAHNAHLPVEKSPLISRPKPDLNFGVWGEELERLMDLDEHVPFPETPIKGMNAYKVCQWIETHRPEEESIRDEAARFKPMLLEQVRRLSWEGWKKSLRSRAKIEVLQEL